MADFSERYFGAAVGSSAMAKSDVRALQRSWKRHLIAFIESLPHEARVLDVGCGKGKTIHLIGILRPDVRISGMDMTNVRSFLPEGTAFVQASVGELSTHYQAASFDAVICQHVIEHLLYPTELIEGISTVLRSGGKVFIETPNWTRLIVPFSPLWFWNDYTHVHPYSRTAIHRLFDDYGFQILSIRTVSSYAWFPHHAVTPSAAAHFARINHQVPRQGVIARIAARILNPLVRDILVAVAEKPDSGV